MKKLTLLSFLIVLAGYTFAQQQTFDLATFTPPKGWDKKEGKDAIQLSKHDEKSDSYCLITLYKSTPGIADSKENFDMAWTSLVKETIPVSTAPEMQPAATENGWEIQSGHAPYEIEGTKGVAMLVTASSAEKMVNMIILTNTDMYEKEMTAFIESISLKKLETLPVGQPENPQQSPNTSKETFDLITYSPPKGWTKNVEETLVSYVITDNAKNTWCRINIVKSTISKGSIEADFENEWQDLVVKNYNPTDKPKESDIQEAEGWKIKVGTSKFTFDNSECSAMLTTASGYERCVSIVAVANNRDYINNIQAFIESIDLLKPEKPSSPTETNKLQTEEQQNSVNTPLPAKQDGFAFTTTNFDDGWTSTVQEDWVEVTKGNVKALLHFPCKRNTNSSDPDPITNDAWNILVAPRYSNLKNYLVKYVSSYDRVHLAAGNLTDNATGKEVYVAFISRSSNVWIEFISPDKNAFVQAFGIDFDDVAWNSDKTIFDPLLKLANCNKFAVAASDLTGKWSSNSSSVQQYYNVYTGDNAGMNLNTASRTFQFGAGNTYQWNFVWVNGFSGSEKVVQEQSAGTFSLPNNWQVYFSKIESGPETYDAYFTCIKGGRILWMNDANSPGSGKYTGFGKAE